VCRKRDFRGLRQAVLSVVKSSLWLFHGSSPLSQEGRGKAQAKGQISSYMVHDPVIASPADIMQRTIGYLKAQYGGVEGYLKASQPCA